MYPFEPLDVTVRFFAKHLDSDLACMVERTVPPIQLDSIGKFKSALFKYQRKAWPRDFFLLTGLAH